MDILNEVYYRKAFSRKEQDNLRDRIHWICEQVEGETVLDMACSQGITSILLGREGFSVVGVDINPKAIGYANEELEKESVSVRNKVQFICDDIKELSFEKKFDVVVMGEVLEHVFNPDKLIKVAKQNLVDNGTVIITVPFGYLPDIDHKKTFYFSSMLDLLEENGVYIEYIGIKGNRLAIKGKNTNKKNNISYLDLLRKTEIYIDNYMIEMDREIRFLRNSLNDAKKESVKNDENLKSQNQLTLLINEIDQKRLEINDLQDLIKVLKIKAKQNEEKIQENEELNFKLSKTEMSLRNIKNKCIELETDLDILYNGMRYKIGDEIVHALLNPLPNIFKLPFTLPKLLFQGYKKVRARNDEDSSSTEVVSNQQKNEIKHFTVNNKKRENDKQENVLDKINKFKLEVTHTTSKIPITIACIMDTFSYECFKYECDLKQLKFNSWRQQIEEIKPDILFVESAWNGVDNSWQFMLVDLQNKPEDCQIRKLIAYCNENSIPTVFWNKEDPTNYEKFIELAKLFDYVFTTEKNIIPKYKTDLNHDRVFPLSFAAQPAIHNPINSNYFNKDDIAFAGSWYSKYEDRNKDMEILLDSATKYNLNIFDRFYNYEKSENYKFPEKYREFIVGSLDYEDMLKAYRLYKIFLNVNTVVDSETMFSRRVYELLASGSNVVSTYSKGIEKLFDKCVPIVSNSKQADQILKVLIASPEYSNRLSVIGVREILSHHTYRHRLEYLLKTIGVSQGSISKPKSVSIITVTKREEYIDNVFNNYENQIGVDKELIIVLNSLDMNIEKWEERARKHEKVKILQFSEETSLGSCLNHGISEAQNEYIAKFDDDDYYAPNYLLDTMHAFSYTNADLVGKSAIYTYMENLKAIAIRNSSMENRYVNFVYGSTLVFKKEVFNKVKFHDRNRGEDTNFLNDCTLEGFKIYSNNRYNYIYIRRSNPNHHTWQIDEMEYLKNCEILFYTEDYATHVTV